MENLFSSPLLKLKTIFKKLQKALQIFAEIMQYRMEYIGIWFKLIGHGKKSNYVHLQTYSTRLWTLADGVWQKLYTN